MKEIQEARLKGLEHEDFFVRSVMLRILSRDPDVGPEAARRAVRQIDEYGWAGAFDFSHQIADLPHSEDTVEWATRWLERSAPKRDEATANQQYHVAHWFCKAPLVWLSPRIDRVVETVMAELPPKTGMVVSKPARFKNPGISFDLAVERLAASCLSTADCLARLEELLSACALVADFPHDDVAKLDVFSESLATRRAVSEKTLCKWLEFDFDPDGEFGVEDFRIGAALQVITYGKSPPPVGPLLNLFELDWDWINELIIAALVSTGNNTTLRSLLDSYAGHNWAARLYLTAVFESLQYEECESTLCEALRNEKEDDLRVKLAYALAVYGSPESVALAREVAREHPDDPERGEVLDLLCAHDILLGNQSDETRRHRRKIAKQLAESKAAQKQIESWFQGSSGGMSLEEPRDYFTSQPKEEKSNILPFRPAKPKPTTGRNDPCPCGSGKKFKKCCLSRS